MKIKIFIILILVLTAAGSVAYWNYAHPSNSVSETKSALKDGTTYVRIESAYSKDGRAYLTVRPAGDSFRPIDCDPSKDLPYGTDSVFGIKDLYVCDAKDGWYRLRTDISASTLEIPSVAKIQFLVSGNSSELDKVISPEAFISRMQSKIGAFDPLSVVYRLEIKGGQIASVEQVYLP